MARYNKIFAGPTSEVLPQVQELPADASTLPGCLIYRDAGKFKLAGEATWGKLYVAQDNYLTLKGVDDAYGVDEVVIGMELLDGQLFNLRFPTGVNIALDAPITTGASGKAALASDGDLVIAYAEEAFNNNTGTDQLVRVRAAKGYIIPVGD